MFNKPGSEQRIPPSTLAYFRSRGRSRLFSAIHREIRSKGVTQAELARRLGKDPAQINRLLSLPRNLTIDSVAEILFAVAGGEFDYKVEYPLEKPSSNNSLLHLDLDGPGLPSTSTRTEATFSSHPMEART